MTQRHQLDDVVVVLPGIMGSTLHRDGVPVWEPSGAALIHALMSLLRNVNALRLPDGIGDGHPGDRVEAVGLMPDIRMPFGVWTFDLGYDALLKFLRQTFDLVEATPGEERPANLVVFPYDWRLSNRYNGERLRTVAEGALARWRERGGRYAQARLVFIAHSMGGLVARWYLDRLGGAEVTRKLITLGTPHRGSLRALEQLCNGVRKGPGPFRLNLTTFARSLPSLHQLLPEYASIERDGGLAKTTEVTLPELVTEMVGDAMAFHDQIDTDRADRAHPVSYELHPICGFRQPTWTTARLDGGRIVPIRTIDGHDGGGDATVPRLAAAPPDVNLDSATIHHVADNHSGLVHNRNVFDELEGILTASSVRYRGGDVAVSVEIDEVLEADETLRIAALLPDNDRVALEAVITAADGRPVDIVRLPGENGAYHAELRLPDPGLYRIRVQGVGPAVHRVIPVTAAVLVWPPEHTFDFDQPVPTT